MIEKAPFYNLHFEEILFFDWLLLGYAKDKWGNIWIKHWCDEGENGGDIYMYYVVDKSALQNIIKNNKGFRNAIIKNREIYLVDETVTSIEYKRVPPNQLPESYIPEV